MANLQLKTALQTLGHTQALKDKSAQPYSFDFQFEEVPAIIQAFRRMVRGSEFDISEMAMTTYLCARANGKRFTALPIFLVRAFHHAAIVHNSALGIRVPKDLEGKKVGVNRGYTVTTGVWARGVLQHDHGVDLSKITWVLSGDEHVAEYQVPGNVVSIEKGKKLEDMLISGEIAAAIGVAVEHPDVKPLIPNAKAVGFEQLQTSGYYPINHALVVRDELLEAHPGLALEIFNVFAESKRRYVARLKNNQISEPSPGDQRYRRVMEITGTDPLPYGIDPNRAMLERAVASALEQGIITQRVEVDALFAPSTRGLVG